MKTLAEVREQYPQYKDMPDEALAGALHKKFYSDMPYEQFSEKIGIQKPKPADLSFEKSMQDELASRPAWERGLAGAGTALDNAALWLKQKVQGLNPEEQNRVVANREIQNDPAGLVGNLVGTIGMAGGPAAALERGVVAGLTKAAPSAATRVLAPTAAAAGTGAATAVATTPLLEGETTAGVAAGGAMGGALGNAGARALSRLIQPITQSAPVKKLMGEGVVPAPGQAAGADSFLGKVEQRLSSIPVIGDIINRGRQRAVNEFNVAAINRAAPGVKEAGRAGLEQAEDILGTAYDDVLSKWGPVQFDPKFPSAVSTALNKSSVLLTKAQKDDVLDIVKTRVADQFGKGPIDGQLAKQIDSELGQLARSLQGSAVKSENNMATAIREVQTAFRGMMEKSAPSPEAAATLKDLNTKWANLVRVQKAASSQGAKDGIFTPSQLARAVRTTDPSKGKRDFGKGNALMQDLSEAGEATLRGTVPNSGTTDRALMAMLMGGGLGVGNEYLGGPGYLTALALSPALYSRAGSKYLAGGYPLQGVLSQAAAKGGQFATPAAAQLGVLLNR
jgi:hypothetical protein